MAGSRGHTEADGTLSRRGTTARRAFVLAPLLAAGLLAAGVGLAPENQMAIAGAGLAAMLAAWRLGGRHPEASRLLIILIGAFISLRYWFFRTTATLAFTAPWEAAFMLLLYAAETYAVATHLLGAFVNLAPIARRSPPLPRDPARLPAVDVLVPTYDEPASVVAVTLAACRQLDYPPEKLTVTLLDDGATDARLNDPDPARAEAARRRRAEFEALTAALGVRYRRRPDNRSAKAGNLNHGLRCACGEERDTPPEAGWKSACVNAALDSCGGELVLILDCDHVPTRDFLRHTVGFFLADEKLAFVQTPHRFINPTAVERNLGLWGKAPAESEMFYGAVHPGMDLWNASFFCGSAALLRRRHLAAVGGIAGETVTEDAETALLLHARGYRSVYLNRPMAVGLSPESFEDLIAQRRRWAQGMVQILRRKNPLRLPGLSPAQRVCYLNACLHWLFGPARLVFLTAPLLFLLAGLRVYNASLEQVIAYTLPHLAAATLVSRRLYGARRQPFFSTLFETVQSAFLTPAVLTALAAPRRPRFRVTPKAVSRERDRLSPLAWPFYVLFLLALAAYPMGWERLVANRLDFDAALICLVWNSFNLVLILCGLGVVWNRRQIRRAHRHEAREPVLLKRENGDYLPARLVNLSVTGVAVTLRAEGGVIDSRLTLEAADSDGRTTRLPLKVVRREAAGSGWLLGCEFDTGPGRLEAIVGFVFGDSRRYRYFADSDRTAPVGLPSALGALLFAGLRGSALTLWAASLILLDIPRRFVVITLRRIFSPRERGSRDEGAESPPAPGAPGARAGRPAVGRNDPHTAPETRCGGGHPPAGDQGQPAALHPRARTLESECRHPPL